MEYLGTPLEFQAFYSSMDIFSTLEKDPNTGKATKLREIPGELAFAFRRNRRAFLPLLEDFAASWKESAIKFAKKDETGAPIIRIEGDQERVDLEDLESFQKEMEALAGKKIKVELCLVSDDIIKELGMVDEELLGLIAWIFEGELESLTK